METLIVLSITLCVVTGIAGLSLCISKIVPDSVFEYLGNKLL